MRTTSSRNSRARRSAVSRLPSRCGTTLRRRVRRQRLRGQERHAVQRRAALCASSQSFLAGLFEDKRPEHLRKKRPPTMATMFKKSVTELVDDLTRCNPHYIRTIKPNENKRPGEYDVDRCSTRCSACSRTSASVCRLLPRAGGEVFGRFKLLCPETWPRGSAADRRRC